MRTINSQPSAVRPTLEANKWKDQSGRHPVKANRAMWLYSLENREVSTTEIDKQTAKEHPQIETQSKLRQNPQHLEPASCDERTKMAGN